MSDERILLDNLQGKVTALTALCSTLLISHPGAETLLEQFKQTLSSLQPHNTESDNYWLGIKSIHDHLESSMLQKKIYLTLLAAPSPEC